MIHCDVQTSSDQAVWQYLSGLGQGFLLLTTFIIIVTSLVPVLLLLLLLFRLLSYSFIGCSAVYCKLDLYPRI